MALQITFVKLLNFITCINFEKLNEKNKKKKILKTKNFKTKKKKQ